MSLLHLEMDPALLEMAQTVFERQFERDPKLQKEYDARRKRRMLMDVQYNLVALDVTIRHQAKALFFDHVRWLLEILVYRMPDHRPERVKEQLMEHLDVMGDVVAERWGVTRSQRARTIIAGAKTALSDTSIPEFDTRSIDEDENALAKCFLDHLLSGEKVRASQFITSKVEAGMALPDIYLHVFKPAMYEIGRRWQQNRLTVDKEHYCTAIAQAIMAQFYPQIFSTPRKQKTILAACVGSELHEMGVRMLCDVFELEGWDSIYLGAAVPEAGLMNAIDEHHPDLVALSVTMIHHLDTCFETVRALNEDSRRGTFRLAVGGRATRSMSKQIQKWGVDAVASDAETLVEWASR